VIETRATLPGGVHGLNLSRSVIGVLLAVGLIGVTQLAVGRSFFPGLHTILDTAMLLLSGMLSLLFWDLGSDDDSHALTKRIAVAFAVTSFAEFLHAFVSIEWTGALAFVTRAADMLRPTTWPPAAHLLPIGIACSVWLMRSGNQRVLRFAVALVLVGVGFFSAFYWLPRYTAPVWLDVTRPTLVLVPAMWAVVAWTCWKQRAADRTLTPLAMMAAVIFFSSVSMLYSASPHDSQAMVAHLGRVGGYLAVLLSLLKMASSDMRQLVRTERKLALLNEELEVRVRDRTAELASTNQSLEYEVAVRRQTEAKVQGQLEKLNLLHQITRAIGGREDLRSIYQVVLRSLEENLSFDFGCLCDYDELRQELTVVHIGIRSQPLAFDLALTEQAHIPIDANGLSRCVRGQLVYEPDIAEVKMPFPERLTRAGLHSLVAAPLLVESKVFGVFVAARRESHNFTSGECEFLRQLSEHVALAAHQAQLHASLQQAYDDLRQTQQAVMQQERLRALGEMASGIAHDINNALSPMALYTDLLLDQEQDLSPKTRKHLLIIQRASDDVAKTVARMREFYRQREPQMSLSPVQLNTLLQQVAELTRARWSDMPLEQGVVIEMRSEFAQDAPAIMGVESEIREALTNLIFNAVDAMPDGGTVTLRTRTTQHSAAADEGAVRDVIVEVSDTGMGMDEATRRRCLEPFFTTKGDRGTGLGLAMVYGVVQRHSADLEIESCPGKGTTVRLGFRAPSTISTDTGQPEEPITIPSRMKILVVDDDPLLIKALCETLESDGHHVVTANGGQAGIDAFGAALAQGKPFAVVITDLGMPRVDGRKVASSIKSASETTPVILLTGWGQRLVADGDVPAHVDRVLAKPPKLRDLREALLACVQSADPGRQDVVRHKKASV
jgi:signal transduction histidine kinase/ActR/RegA family two-component response regulator